MKLCYLWKLDRTGDHPSKQSKPYSERQILKICRYENVIMESIKMVQKRGRGIRKLYQGDECDENTLYAL
jgi:hypothetical protein